jgi:hypothetical protein
MRQQARIAIYGGGGAPYHHAAILARAGHRVDFVFPVDILNGVLRGFDAFVMPGGGYRAMRGQIDPLGRAGARAIREYVESGGMYIGSCAGSYDAARAPASFLSACPAQEELCLLDAEIWNAGEEWLGLQSPGVGVVRAQTVLPDHPVMSGMPEHFEIVHYNGPLFRGGEALAIVEGATEDFTPAEGFLREHHGPTLIEQAAQQHIPNIVAGSLGAGRVVLFGSHPEFGFTLGMEDEQEAARMLRNAVAWQLDENGGKERPNVLLYAHNRPTSDDDLVAQVQRKATSVRECCASLRERDGEPSWLQRGFAMSIFGMQPCDIWEMALDTICHRAQEVEEHASSVDLEVLAFRSPVDWQIDGGYQGVLALVEQSEQLLAQALETWDINLGQPASDPYAFVHSSPYHLVAGSYLAAVGRMVGAKLLCEIAGRTEG